METHRNTLHRRSLASRQAIKLHSCIDYKRKELFESLGPVALSETHMGFFGLMD